MVVLYKLTYYLTLQSSNENQKKELYRKEYFMNKIILMRWLKLSFQNYLSNSPLKDDTERYRETKEINLAWLRVNITNDILGRIG